mmetsp:Transcript_38713/g.82353  ORF Transcript_38713/g.82353 Transcript_38713/m.82353 type:complete len:189 (+) Transcript_38713:73-639(+)
MELLRVFCNSESCNSRRRSASSAAAGGRAPGKAPEEENPSSFLEHLQLRPSVVDDGELQFPSRAQARRKEPPRGSSAPRQGSTGSKPLRNQSYGYTGADFLDLPPSAPPLQRPPSSGSNAWLRAAQGGASVSPSNGLAPRTVSRTSSTSELHVLESLRHAAATTAMALPPAAALAAQGLAKGPSFAPT